MARAAMQVLVLPFRLESSGVRFCVLRRSDDGRWQGVAGGGQDGETPEQAARREAWEEIGLPPSAPLYRLQSMDTVPVADFEARALWPADLYAVPQYTFGADVGEHQPRLSAEHRQCRWVTYRTARRLLYYQSNQNALWELHERIGRADLPQAFSPDSAG